MQARVASALRAGRAQTRVATHTVCRNGLSVNAPAQLQRHLSADASSPEGSDRAKEPEEASTYSPPRQFRNATSGPLELRKAVLRERRELREDYLAHVRIREARDEEIWQADRREYLLQEKARNAETFRLKQIQKGIVAADYMRKRAIWDRRIQVKAAKRVSTEQEKAATRKEFLQALKATCDKWEFSPDETRYRRYQFPPNFQLEGTKFERWVRGHMKYGRS